MLRTPDSDIANFDTHTDGPLDLLPCLCDFGFHVAAAQGYHDAEQKEHKAKQSHWITRRRPCQACHEPLKVAYYGCAALVDAH